MVFSSVLFLVYFLPLFLIGYFAMPTKFRNGYLLISSILFYSWGAPRFIFVILGTTILDFILVNQMDKSQNKWKRKAYLICSVTVNLGLLFYFKYSNFFIENINYLLSSINVQNIHWLKLALPIGISFYTFETITYVVDVYRRVHAPQPNFWNYQLYIIFFPKLIAGPIIRYHEFADQISKRFYTDDFKNRLAGFTRFCFGLGKKIILANPCGQLADTIMGYDINVVSTPLAWLGILAYTLQIYFDFSGYSDMAIGLGRMMGFVLPENFNNPYISKSITEFWRRWHITLGNWMRNYLYIPLGGNRVTSNVVLYRNLFVVFLASGFWHGASWNFIIWGAYHGIFLVIERAWLLKKYESLSVWITVPLNFIVVMIGWVFFRIESFEDAIFYLNRMFVFEGCKFQGVQFQQVFFVIIATLFAFNTLLPIGKKLEQYFYHPTFNNSNQKWLFTTVAAMIFIVALSRITATGFNPFIYFRF